MPKPKSKAVVESSGSSSGSDSEGSSSGAKTKSPAAKRKRSAGGDKSSSAGGGKGAHRVDDIDGAPAWKLATNRNVTVSEFKGRVYVNIREYYEKDGKALPGKKGISLPQQQWEALLESAAEISAVLKEKQ